MICGEFANLELSKKHPSKFKKVCAIILVDRNGQSIIQDKILKVCQGRKDKMSMEVKSRVIFAQDLRAVDSIYHNCCMKSFMSKRSIKYSGTTLTHNHKNLQLDCREGFHKLCEWLKDNNHLHHTLEELKNKLQSFLPTNVLAYSKTYLKHLLINYFGDEIFISELKGKNNIVSFVPSASDSVHMSYSKSHENIDENIDIQKAGKKLKSV